MMDFISNPQENMICNSKGLLQWDWKKKYFNRRKWHILASNKLSYIIHKSRGAKKALSTTDTDYEIQECNLKWG